ncbi:MAG: 30S ribosomal protein S17 [Patescibacteria group bacterium]
MENKKIEKIVKTKKKVAPSKKAKMVPSKEAIVKKPVLKTAKKVTLKEKSKVVSSNSTVPNNKVIKPKESKSKVNKPLKGIVLLPQVNGSKCVRVRVLKYVPHPLYKKLIKKTKIYLVACEIDDVLNIGDEISFIKTRPISKRISFKYVKDLGVK